MPSTRQSKTAVLGLTIALGVGCGGSPPMASSSGSSTGGQSSSGTSSAAGATTTATSIGTATTSGAASGSTSGGTGTSGMVGSSSSGTSTGFPTAAHNPLPQVPNGGAGILASPEVITVSYAGDAYDVKGYFQALVQSDWLSAVGADYGVGLGQVTGSVVLDGGPGGPAAVTDADIVDLLTQLIHDGGVPPVTANSVYVVAYPQGTVVSVAKLGSSCVDFSGFHNRFVLDGTWIPYCVVPTCRGAPGSVLTTEVSLREVLSHEFIEAATDPIRTPTMAGFAIADPSDPFSYGGGEVGDLCELSPPYEVPDGGLIAQRIWSNSAARRATSSPCVPAPAGEVYFNVSIDPDTTVLLDGGASQARTISFNVTGWSTASTEDWALWAYPGQGTIDPVQLNPQFTGSSNPLFMNNGKTATLTITVPAGTPSGSYASVLLYSYFLSANQIDAFGSFAFAAVRVQ